MFTEVIYGHATLGAILVSIKLALATLDDLSVEHGAYIQELALHIKERCGKMRTAKKVVVKLHPLSREAQGRKPQ